MTRMKFVDERGRSCGEYGSWLTWLTPLSGDGKGSISSPSSDSSGVVKGEVVGRETGDEDETEDPESS